MTDNEQLPLQLHLIEILAAGHYLSVKQLADRTGMHTRRIYRLLEKFPRLGLTLEKSGHAYRLSPDAPFLVHVSAHLHFRPDEIQTMATVLESLSDTSTPVRLLREKIRRLRNDHVLVLDDSDQRIGQNIRQIFEAIRQERTVVLKSYLSASGNTIADRIVEPYLFLPGNRDVRCFEIHSRTNKTFNLARTDSVELLDLNWNHRDEHETDFVDLFHFTGSTRTRVCLRLGYLSRSVLIDEYPRAAKHLTAEENGKWRFEADFCSMRGIGRFVLSMPSDIEVIDSPELVDYLREQVQIAQSKWGATFNADCNDSIGASDSPTP